MLLKLRRSKKGFTLAELLIVIAIIAVLIAIAVPVFTSVLTKAEIAVHESNARAVHGESTAKYLLEENGTGDISYTGVYDGVTYIWTVVDGAATANVKHDAASCTVTGCTIASPGETFTISAALATS